MIPEEMLLLVASDENKRNIFIREYMPYIRSSASKITGRFISENDDEFSIALIAFNEAIDRYETGKGAFLSYAFLVIKSRLTDYMRKTKNEPILFSVIEEQNEGLEVVGISEIVSDVAMEIEALKRELSFLGISFMELSKYVPKARKTKTAIAKIVKYITEDNARMNKIRKNGNLPVSDIFTELSIHKKVVERHRKYIVSAVVILSGEYEHIKPYIMGIFDNAGVRK